MRLESLWGDIRFAFRIFMRSSAVALTVIGTLAVALGLNATAYSFFNAYVVKPAAVHDPGTLYQASWENRGGFFHRFAWTEAARFGREMAGVFPETYVPTAKLLTRINGRPAVGELVVSLWSDEMLAYLIRDKQAACSGPNATKCERIHSAVCDDTAYLASRPVDHDEHMRLSAAKGTGEQELRAPNRRRGCDPWWRGHPPPALPGRIRRDAAVLQLQLQRERERLPSRAIPDRRDRPHRAARNQS